VGTQDPLPAEVVAAATAAALERAAALGATVAQVRVERISSRHVSLRDARVEHALDDVEVGVGVRVVHRGALGFAGASALDPDAAAGLAERAVALAEAVAPALRAPVELAPEPVHGDVSWRSPWRVDPTDVPIAETVELLASWSSRLLGTAPVEHATAELLGVSEEKHYADLAGTSIHQHRVRVHPVVEVFAAGGTRGGFTSVRTLAPPAGRGLEYLFGEGWDLDGEIAELPGHLEEKLAAPSVEAGVYDLVVDPTNLWLTIHESIGHATELDRALGYEAAYAGTSFATPDRLGELRYGSPLLQVSGDRVTPHGLATIGYDDEGVEAQRFEIVRDGILVGYQVDRVFAARAGLGRSNGCAFADSPLHVPLQRMANVSIAAAPGLGPTVDELVSDVRRGIYVVGDKSWSIDMQRQNFQFSGQRFYRIVDGRLAGQVADVAYQGRTTEFWGSLDGLGGESTYVLGGAFNCGKGQPGQAAPVSHGCPAALFRNVRVLNVREEVAP
jgi:TldD protein